MRAHNGVRATDKTERQPFQQAVLRCGEGLALDQFKHVTCCEQTAMVDQLHRHAEKRTTIHGTPSVLGQQPGYSYRRTRGAKLLPNEIEGTGSFSMRGQMTFHGRTGRRSESAVPA